MGEDRKGQIAMNDTIKLLQSHRSIRKYEDKPIEEEKLLEIIKMLLFALWVAIVN